ncbi:hypothetical protein SLA2020_104250 [Shorea laevis]
MSFAAATTTIPCQVRGALLLFCLQFSQTSFWVLLMTLGHLYKHFDGGRERSKNHGEMAYAYGLCCEYPLHLPFGVDFKMGQVLVPSLLFTISKCC